MAVKVSKTGKKAKRCCLVCGKVVPQRRLKVLPDTMTCVKCASVSRYASTDVPGTVFAQHFISPPVDGDE